MSSEIPLDRINEDPGLQMRAAGVDPATVAEYAEAMEDGAAFPPITLYFDGEAYWPADGFHRIAAARRLGRETIAAVVTEGGRRDAVLHACGANASHGLRRTHADKRRAVEALLRDPEWSRWSDRAIGKQCGVDHKTVARVRREEVGKIPTERTYLTKHGTTATMTIQPAKKPSGKSMVEQMLAKVSTEALIEECRRRGLEVAA